ncbi:MAG: acetate--CoA ligase family protein, partial [Methanosarcinales archaeon]|nr:acetate--CoA ligase family protein [Methanosarcinales archaeon]
GIKNGPEFMEIARRVSKVKPVIIVKSGRSAVGSRAVSSHTGTLAGSDDAYNAAFRQSGVIRADSIEEMLDYSRAFSSQPIPAGTNMAILTNAGGFGIITADACSAKGMSLASFTETTIERLRNRLSPAANFYNPVDILGDASAELYEYALDVILDDPNVDGVILLTSPQAMTDIEKIALVVAERSKSSEISKSTKPILCSFVGGTRIAEGEKVLNYNNIPNYPFPERAVSSMHALCTYSAIRQQTYEPQPVADAVRKKAREMGASIIENACRDKRRILGLESLDILKAYNIPIIETANTDTLSETIDACERIGYPIVMKILSPDISHKSDVGGIRLNLNNAGDVERAYHTMMSDIRRYLPDAAIEGVQVQKMMTGGKEIIIGMVRDVQFGPLLMFGLGGTYVEFLKDVSFAVAPINAEEAKHMVTSIKTYPLLAGVRGEAPSDINSIIDSIVKISQMVLDFPQILEFEINPLMVLSDGEGCLAMDIRMTLGEECE